MPCYLKMTKKGGGVISKRCSHFSDFVETKNLHDLGFQGSSFTWQREGVYERLDRALGNEAWCQTFSKCLITHLERIKSNHHPLSVDTFHNMKLPRGRPFRFLARWTKHEDFTNVVKNL